MSVVFLLIACFLIDPPELERYSLAQPEYAVFLPAKKVNAGAWPRVRHRFGIVYRRFESYT